MVNALSALSAAILEVVLSVNSPNQFIGRHLNLRSIRTLVILSQLPFFVTITLIRFLILIAVLDLAVLMEPSLLIGWSRSALLFLACFVVPWKNAPGIIVGHPLSESSGRFTVS
ncbi:hypothetical protein [Arthrobacter psychrochitiniphilus]|uniref:Uncharacterized protein n=1 Tax=Arthrobacter psychrochitiniphilus TaxID=291045 RepID=A0A2V3DXN3_9MICC|nr:hypothetical protein [Arthrobacter psychrochitiniphilus]NYG16603.1 hypothetical protein [Arthrobacter psychrochitiniphilus]PXA69280.1 hypothetical protein CVS29_01550 [Arthrobacter psychrochitiniphilus]